jgi:hypothetical protein
MQIIDNPSDEKFLQPFVRLGEMRQLKQIYDDYVMKLEMMRQMWLENSHIKGNSWKRFRGLAEEEICVEVKRPGRNSFSQKSENANIDQRIA